MKSFTERNPRRIGLAVVAATLVAVLAVLLLNRSIFASTYTVNARFPDTAGVGPGTDVLVAGVKVGSVTSVQLEGNHVMLALAVDRGVQLPHDTAASISVQTLLGQLDVDLRPVSGWNRPLRGGAILTSTSTPVELYDIQNEAGGLFSNTDATAINQLIESLSAITQGKQAQVRSIVNGLNNFTGVVDQRSTQVSQLIDAANTLSSTVDSRDSQLASAIDNLSTVVDGLAQHGTDLGNLIDNTQQAAAQIETLVGANSPQLTQLLSHLESVLGVLSNHQLDLSQGVSALASAVTGFSSVGYSGSQDTPNSWANIYTNLLGTSGVYGVLGPCGALDEVLNQTLGPDPLPCDQQTGPLGDAAATSLPSSSNPAASGSSNAAASPATGASSPTTTTTAPAGAGSSSGSGLGGVLGLGSLGGDSSSGGSGPSGSPKGGLGGLLPPLLGGLVVSRRVRSWTVIVVTLAVLGAAVLLSLPSSAQPYQLQAVFAAAPGLYPGNTVEILGVPAGQVVRVTNTGATVTVAMEVDSNDAVPSAATAALVSPELLGEPSIELAPGYTRGPQLSPGATIPLSRTSVPVSTDQLLRDLQSFLSKINPNATGTLISNLAQDVSGEGPALNQLLGNAAGTLRLLADKGNDLGQLTGTLAQISSTLRSRTSTITSLIEQYDKVSQVVASHQAQLGSAITDLSGASTELSQFLAPNLQPIQTDVAGITTVGRNLSQNLASIDQTLSSAVLLFAAAQRAYDPSHQWLNLNDTLAPGVTVSILTGLIRDRLAGICRRLAANHSAGLSASTLQTLATCGNPSSGFFDPLFGDIPPIINALTSGPDGTPSPTALQALLSQGLAMIPGAAAATSPTSTAAAATPAATPTTTPAATPPASTTTTTTPPSLNTPGTTQLPTAPTVPTDGQANSSSGSGGLLGGLLGGL